jgi:hypothetical protein
MTMDWIYRLDLWMVFLLTIALFAIATEVGVRLGKWAQARGLDSVQSHIGTLESAVLGLLALMLGFTFAMSLSRYDNRKELVLAEADAIGTSYLRAQLLPSPHNEEVPKLLRNYVDVRLKFYGVGVDDDGLREAYEKTEQLHQQIWSHAIALSGEQLRAGPVRLFIESMNEVIDLHAKRSMAMRDHVPSTVFLLLYTVATIGFGFVGFASGLSGHRHLLVTFLLVILISSVISLIADLDRPRRGLIKVSQQSLIELRQTLDKDYK